MKVDSPNSTLDDIIIVLCICVIVLWGVIGWIEESVKGAFRK